MMKQSVRVSIVASLAVIAFAFFGLVSRAAAMDAPHVQDDAKFFSDDARSKADAKIAEIKSKFRKDLYLVTFASLPDDLKAKYSQDNKSQFYRDWAVQIARTNQIDGIIVLITRDPSHLQVEVGKNTIRQAFIQSERDQLAEKLGTAFKAKDFDGGLIGAVDYVDSSLSQSVGTKRGSSAAPANPQSGSSAPAQNRNNTPVPWSGGGSSGPGVGTWLCLGAGVLIVFFLVRGMFASRQMNNPFGQGGAGPMNQGYGNNPGNYGPGYQGGGGGFGRGMLGGVLGGLLGGYAYDKFNHRNDQSPSNSGYIPDNSSSSNDSGASYDSGGGDFSSGAGGDLGGGGADFGGGGDSGGGGGDSGGGSDF